jgi:hypothetical protein
MVLFGSKSLNYSVGDGSLPKLKSSKYFAHHLPGEPTSTQMDFELLSEEAKSGKYESLLEKAINFAIGLEYVSADYNYLNNVAPKSLNNPKIEDPGSTTDEAMSFLANMAQKYIDNQSKVYFEQLPYLAKFEEKLSIELNPDQRKFFMLILRVGMGLSLIENNSGLNINGLCHPSISNILHTPRQVLENLAKKEHSWNLEFLGGNDSQMNTLKLALYIGYFQSKYTAESPSSVMEFVGPSKN